MSEWMGVKSIIDVKCDDKNDRPALGAGSDDDDRTCSENKKSPSKSGKVERIKRVQKSSNKKEEEVRNDRPTRHSKKIQIIYYNWKIACNFNCDLRLHDAHTPFASIFHSDLFFLLLFQLLHSPTNVLCGFTVVQRGEFRMKIATATCSNLPSKTFSSFSHRAPTGHDYSHTTYKNISNSSSRK